MIAKWTAKQIPDPAGRVAVVTGAAVMAVTNRLFAQSAEMGALPTLYAATYPGLEGGTLIGPGGIGEQRGHPKPVPPRGRALDEALARRLWNVSEQLTGVRFALPAEAVA